jgi:hypothetical protein
MAEEKAQLIEQVVALLTDFRSTLQPAQQSILDEIVIGRMAEVEGHAMDPGLGVHGRIAWENESYSVQPRSLPKSQMKNVP